jgi:HSP20 family protein
MKLMSLYNDLLPTFNGAYRADPFELLDRVFESEPYMTATFRTPAVDVREESDRYVIVAELPGLSEKDLKLELKDGVLALSTAKVEDKEGESKIQKWIRRERREFEFKRSFELPENADGETIEARFKDGLLTIDVPKRPETAPRVVPVRVA